MNVRFSCQTSQPVKFRGASQNSQPQQPQFGKGFTKRGAAAATVTGLVLGGPLPILGHITGALAGFGIYAFAKRKKG